MTTDKLVQLGKKIAAGSASNVDKFNYLKELNATIQSLRDDVVLLKQSKS